MVEESAAISAGPTPLQPASRRASSTRVAARVKLRPIAEKARMLRAGRSDASRARFTAAVYRAVVVVLEGFGGPKQALR
jgi:hypothetical protein